MEWPISGRNAEHAYEPNGQKTQPMDMGGVRPSKSMTMKTKKFLLILLFLFLHQTNIVLGTNTQERMDNDIGVKNSNVLNPEVSANKQENDAIVLACKSEQYFLSRLNKLGSHPLVLTTGLMAPEAYSLDAAIKKWIVGGDETQVKKAAANGYNKYQKTGQKAAERLFGVK